MFIRTRPVFRRPQNFGRSNDVNFLHTNATPTIKHGGKLAELFGSCASGNENMTGHTINADYNVSDRLQKNFQNNDVTGKVYYVPKIMVANVMSLVPKLIEIQEFINRNEICIALFTETWLSESVADSVVNVPGYTIIRKDRLTNSHGGVCAYVRESQVKFKHLEDLSCSEKHELLWLYLRPTRLPRGFSCIIVAVLYYPPGSDQDSILDHPFYVLDGLSRVIQTVDLSSLEILIG